MSLSMSIDTSDFQLANDPEFRFVAFGVRDLDLHECCAAMSSYGEDTRVISDNFRHRRKVTYGIWIQVFDVYSPTFAENHFCCLSHNPAGSTKLRDYSGENHRVLGQPPTQTSRRHGFGRDALQRRGVSRKR